MTRVLITGSAGLLGGRLLAQAVDRFHAVGIFHQQAPRLFPESCIRLDLAESAQVDQMIAEVKPDVIIHAAAVSNLDQCETHPHLAARNNVVATQNLVNTASAIQARLIFISSDMVFDGRGEFYREDDRPAPLSVYGAAKLEAEEIVKRTENYVIVRSALIYGRGGGNGFSFSDWLEQQLSAGRKVQLYHDQFRTPIFVENLAQLILELAESSYIGLLHAGGPERMSRLEFGRLYCQLSGYDQELLQPCSMDEHQFPARRPRDVSLNIDRLRSLLSTPIRGVAESIEKIVQDSRR